MRGYLLEVMTKHGLQKLKCPAGSISRRKTPGKVIWSIPDADIPREFVKTVITESIDRTAIKATLESGRELPWAEIISGETVAIRG
jgi:hypothetical protein